MSIKSYGSPDESDFAHKEAIEAAERVWSQLALVRGSYVYADGQRIHVTHITCTQGLLGVLGFKHKILELHDRFIGISPTHGWLNVDNYNDRELSLDFHYSRVTEFLELMRAARSADQIIKL